MSLCFGSRYRSSELLENLASFYIFAMNEARHFEVGNNCSTSALKIIYNRMGHSDGHMTPFQILGFLTYFGMIKLKYFPWYLHKLTDYVLHEV